MRRTYTVEDLPIVGARSAALGGRWQQGFDEFPLFVGEVAIPLHARSLHASSPFVNFEITSRLAVINRAGFRICHQCGFATRSESTSSHKTPLGQDCPGPLIFEDLGHEFQTDVLDLRFEGYSNPDRTFWLSLLYTLLEGASEALHVSRDDLDGCLYIYSENLAQPALILFDNVPGGAGHVQRLVEGPKELEKLLTDSKHRIDSHCCAPETSCYGCLRNYRNQFCHDDLKRGIVLEFLKSIEA